MKGIMELKKPIMVNGAEVKELSYDTDEITAALFCEAEARSRAAAGIKNIAIVPTVEFDFGVHPYLGFAAVIAKNPQIDFSDMERVKGVDLLELMEIGRDFILRSEGSPQKPSAAPSEITAEPITPASQPLEHGV